jgi:hypothetical protein
VFSVNYLEASGHWITYIAVVAGIAYIVALTAVVMRKSWRRALEIGYTRRRLARLIKVSALHALVPAAAVLAGFFTLAPKLGIPLSWWRLSVIGNTSYEIMAADMGLGAAGVTDVGEATGSEFVLIIYVMSLGIMGGMALSVLFSRRIHRGVSRARVVDRRRSALNVSTYMLTVVVVFSVPAFFRLSTALLTLLSGAAVTLIFSALRRRFQLRALDGFAFTASALIAMLSSVLWDSIL